MRQDEIIEMARQALTQEPREDWNSNAWVFADETLKAFAKLVAKKALAEHAMQEVQRLGQEIEQETDWKDGVMEQQEETILWQAKRIAELLDSPPQRKPLSFNEITAIEEKVYMRTTHKGKPAFEYANALIRATEAAHGIKENT